MPLKLTTSMAQSVSDYDMNLEQLTYFPRTRGSSDVLEIDPIDSSLMGCQEQAFANNLYGDNSSSLRISDISEEFPARFCGLVASCSMEKIADHVSIPGHCFPHAVTVRCSKSQETYFDNSEMTCVEIDLDDNVLSSVDALNYDIFTDYSDVNRRLKNSLNTTEELVKESFPYQHVNGVSRLECNLLSIRPCTETISKEDQRSQSGSLSSSFRLDGLLFCGDKLTERKLKCLSFMPHTENLFSGPSTMLRSRSVEFIRHNKLSTDSTLSYPSTKHQLDSHPLSRSVADAFDQLPTVASPSSDTFNKASSAPEDKDDSEPCKDLKDGNDEENNSLMFMHLNELIFNCCSANDQDRPSAARLAKRLFSLDGFRTNDVSRHLCKK